MASILFQAGPIPAEREGILMLGSFDRSIAIVSGIPASIIILGKHTHGSLNILV
jgi:hypothetical protein